MSDITTCQHQNFYFLIFFRDLHATCMKPLRNLPAPRIRPLPLSPLLLGNKVQGYRVEAITQPGGRRSIFKYMSKMAAAAGTGNLGANHTMTEVRCLGDVFLHCRLVEARPATTGIELGRGIEQQAATTDTE